MNRSLNKETKRLGHKYKSTTHYVLSSLIPYSEANLKISFSPHRFFNDLERLDEFKASGATMRTHYYRMIRAGMIAVDENGIPRLTEKGMTQLRIYEPKKLKGPASVLVIFDIPEEDRRSRGRLRKLLRDFKFEPIQQSVWQSKYDVVDYVKSGIKEEGLSGYVQVHESYRVA